MPRSGEIGEKIYEDVEKLVAQGMNRTEAFAKISVHRGRRAGTVAANYYRVARKRAGGSLRKTRSRAGGTTRKAASGARRGTRRAASSAASDIDSIVDDLVKNVQALASALGVHRHTMRYRVRKIEELTGRDLNDARDRLELWLALRAYDMRDRGAAAVTV